MSLINDALKMAQRERTGRDPAPGAQSLIEGFFPYVSTARAERRRGPAMLLAAAVGGVVVIGAVVWFGIPVYRKLTGPASRGIAPIVVAGKPAGPASAQRPSAPVAAPVDTQKPVVAAAAGADSAATAVAVVPDPAPTPPPARRRAKTTSPDVPTEHRVASGDSSVRISLAATPARVNGAPAVSGGLRGMNVELEANAAFQAGDFALAAERFERVIRSAPTASAYNNYGITLERLGRIQAARDAYGKAVVTDGNYLNAWLNLARVSATMGDTAKAIPLYHRALAIDPGSSEVNTELANLEYHLGDYTEAKHRAEKAVINDQSSHRAHYILALVADQFRDRDVAIREYQAFLSTVVGAESANGPNISWARTRLAELRR